MIMEKHEGDGNMPDIRLIYDEDNGGTTITADTSHHGHGVQVRLFFKGFKVESGINEPTLEEARQRVVELLMKKLETIDRIATFLAKQDEFSVLIKIDNKHSIESRQQSHAKVSIKVDIIDIDDILHIKLDEVDTTISDTSITLTDKANTLNKVVIY
jgi:hypothetical protein